MIVTSWQKRIMITQSQLIVVTWAPCPWSHLTGKECNVVTKRITIVLGHFVNRTVLYLSRGIDMINHIYFCQIITANGVVLLVWTSVPRQFLYTVSRSVEKPRRPPECPELCAIPVGMWNRLETGCPFLPKQPFKHNALNRRCHVIDKDVDMNPVS